MRSTPCGRRVLRPEIDQHLAVAQVVELRLALGPRRVGRHGVEIVAASRPRCRGSSQRTDVFAFGGGHVSCAFRWPRATGVRLFNVPEALARRACESSG
jgi:hypothetical protein